MAESIQGSKLPSKEVVEDLCLRFVVNKPIEDTKYRDKNDNRMK